jgi:hypothetical protein
MYPKLYIVDIPFYLTQTKLRSILHDYHLHSLTFIHTVHGDVGMVELDTLENAQKLTATLSRFTLEDGRKVSVFPAESLAGQGIEQLVSRIAHPGEKQSQNMFRRSA